MLPFWFFNLIVLFNIQNGHFDRENFSAGSSMPSSPGQKLCAAVSASTWVEPHGRCTVVFALAWSSPKVKFQKGCTYNRLVSPLVVNIDNTFWFCLHLYLLIQDLFWCKIQLIKYYVSLEAMMCVSQFSCLSHCTHDLGTLKYWPYQNVPSIIVSFLFQPSLGLHNWIFGVRKFLKSCN